MAAPDQLSLYQGACLALKQSAITALDEDLPIRKHLDVAWARNARQKCLQAGLWNFATRTQQIEYEPSITPAFGFRYAFPYPDDYVRIVALSANEYFHPPLMHYRPEAAYFWADIEPIFLAYVSDDADYGLDYSKWPANFEAYVEHYLANEISGTIEGVDALLLEAKTQRMLIKAKGTDAAEEPVEIPQRGSWSRARSNFANRDRSRSRW